ncbi:MAG: VOC family protein [Gammaproteobacteria bacterium]|nr:VOC family protein [Gammaproteobacteria bacterium]
MLITDLHHISFIVSDTKKSLAFYCDILELQVDEKRPDLGYPGAWINIGSYQLHLLELPNPDPTQGRPQHGGRDRHAAFKVDDFARLLQVLENHRIEYTLSRSGRQALFCRDPDGNALEFIA